MNQFGFDRRVEALDNGVIPTVPFATHAAANTMITKKPTVGLAGVLAPAIGVMEHSTWRLATEQRHSQRVEDELLRHSMTHRPPNHAPRSQVENDGEIEPSLLGLDVRYIADPNAIDRLGRLHAKAPLQDVAGDRVRVLGIGRHAKSTTNANDHATAFHDAGNAVAANALALAPQYCVNARTTVRFTARCVNDLDLGQQLPIALLTLGGCAVSPRVVSGLRHSEKATHHPYAELVPVAMNAVES
jgi:hypothetical protein